MIRNVVSAGGVFLLLGLLAHGASAQSAPEILYYPFDEGSGTSVTNHANPGQGSTTSTFIGTPSWVSPGEVGNSAIEFDSSSQLPTGFDSADLVGTDFSVEFWMRYGPISANANYVFSAGVSSFRAFTDGVADEYLLVRAGSDNLAESTTAIGFSTAWHHIAIVHETGTGTTTLYVDGVVEDQTSGITLSTSGEFHIGGYGTSGQQGEHEIDEFRLFDYARTQQQILDEMNGSFYLGTVGSGGPSGAPEIVVYRGGTEIPQQGSDSADLEVSDTLVLPYEIENDGNATLELSSPSFGSVEGISVALESLDNTIDPGNSGTLEIELTSGTQPGSYSFTVELPTNDPQRDPFVFTVDGEVSEEEEEGDDSSSLSAGSRGCALGGGGGMNLLLLAFTLAIGFVCRRRRDATQHVSH